MSDHSDTSSFNGDWETVNDSAHELEQELEKLREEMKKMNMEMEKKDFENAQTKIEISEKNEEIDKKEREIFDKNMVIEKKDSEIKTLQETNEAKDKVNRELLSKLEAVENEMEKQREEMKTMKMKMEQRDAAIAEKKREIERKNEENNKKEGEVNTLREINEALEKEIKDLKAKIEKVPSVSLQEWMKVQMEEAYSSSSSLKKSTIQLYEQIGEREYARAQATTSSAREKMTKDIRKMEKLSWKVSQELVNSNTRSILQITSLLSTVETYSKQKHIVSKEDLPIERFLGEYTAIQIEEMAHLLFGTESSPLRTIIIRKAKEQGYIEVLYKSDNGAESISMPWFPDNLMRSGWSYRIEKNVLIRVKCGVPNADLRFMLTDDGIIINGNYLYYRV